MAKRIIAENKEILLPGWSISRSDVIQGDVETGYSSLVEIEQLNTEPCKCEYRFIKTEKSFSKMTADAVIEIKSKQCAVEIAVTHFVDDLKRNKTEDLSLPMFEIDLSGLKHETDLEKIKAAVLYAPYNRKWIYNPKRNAAIRKKRSEYQQTTDKLAVDRTKRNERDDNEAGEWFIRFGFKGLRWYPFYMDIPISGESVFPYDRRIWQGRLFEEYVYRGIGEFSVDQVWKRLYTGDHNSTGNNERISFEVIRKYIEYLELLGFVSRNGDGSFICKPQITMPPKRKEAKALKAILASVEPCTPSIDGIIERKLRDRLFMVEE